MLTVFGVVAAIVMVVAYAAEGRHRIWIVVFSVGCLAAATYAVVTEAWVFAILETVWAAIAVHRFRARPPDTSW